MALVLAAGTSTEGILTAKAESGPGNPIPDNTEERQLQWGASAGSGILFGSMNKADNLVQENETRFYSLYARWQPATCSLRRNETIDITDQLFALPTFEAGVQLFDYSHAVLHSGDRPYNSELKQAWVVYAAFRRDFSCLWSEQKQAGLSFGYKLENGIGYGTRIFDYHNNYDNLLLGSHLNIYFGTGFFVSWQMNRRWTLDADADFKHLSNGSIKRPNKGANVVGGALHLTYHPNAPLRRASLDETWTQTEKPFRHKLYWEGTIGMGVKSLWDEWTYKRNEYMKDPENQKEPGNHVYACWGLTFGPMYRHSERYASGIALDACYSEAAKAMGRYERLHNRPRGDEKHSNVNLGLSVRHEIFYRCISFPIGIGYYLYNEHYLNVDEDKPIYETVGLRFHFKRLPNLTLGYQIKANGMVADNLELRIGYKL